MKCAEISTGETSATPDDKNELAVRKENRADPGESEVAAAAAAAKPRLHKGGGRGGGGLKMKVKISSDVAVVMKREAND